MHFVFGAPVGFMQMWAPTAQTAPLDRRAPTAPVAWALAPVPPNTLSHTHNLLGSLSPQVKEALLKNIKRRMTPQPLKIRADVEMTCFNYGGIEHIKVGARGWSLLLGPSAPWGLQLRLLS
jgi:hypothetical protein